MSKTYRGYTREQIAATIDHSVLKPTSTDAEIREACELAKAEQTASLCIRPMDVELAVELLAGSGVPVCTVIGFPHGTTTTEVKAFEASQAVNAGALEIDMVINISDLISGFDSAVEADIRAVVAASKRANELASVKVIFETAFLTKEQILKACHLTESAGADYVKTSTGFANEGATIENIRLMKAAVGERLRVKASGGVRTLDQVVDFKDAGVSRCGSSSTAAILAEFDAKAN